MSVAVRRCLLSFISLSVVCFTRKNWAKIVVVGSDTTFSSLTRFLFFKFKMDEKDKFDVTSFSVSFTHFCSYFCSQQKGKIRGKKEQTNQKYDRFVFCAVSSVCSLFAFFFWELIIERRGNARVVLALLLDATQQQWKKQQPGGVMEWVKKRNHFSFFGCQDQAQQEIQPK